MENAWDAPEYCTDAERAASKVLAGTHADVMTTTAGTQQIWTPDGQFQLVTPDDKPLWTRFLSFIKAVPKRVVEPAPVVATPVVPPPAA